MDEIVQAPFGRLKASSEPSGRIEFMADLFEQRIAEHGMRLSWSRSAFCPCRPLDTSLEQPNPACKLCDATGYIYYGSPTPQDLTGEVLTPVQSLLMQQSSGFLIRGLMTSFSKQSSDYDRAGLWERGSSFLTVLFDNKLYFRDRLIALDTDILYRELVKMPAAPATTVPLRYIINGGVLFCRSATQVYTPGTDFTVQNGQLVWIGTRPDAGTPLSISYMTFATYSVSSMAHVVRQQNEIRGTPSVSPEGAIGKLPLMAQVSLTFVPHTSQGAVGG